MVVVVLTNSPPKLRGDLSKWLIEVNPGIYCGNINSKVRDQLWNRICDNIGDGRATMVYTTSGEQHLDFKVYNPEWEPVEMDGIKLIRHPKLLKRTDDLSSPDIKNKFLKSSSMKAAIRVPSGDYCVFDLETTGLSCEKDEIIEVAALRIRNDVIVSSCQTLIRIEGTLPKEASLITGITDQMLKDEGISPEVALATISDFVSGDTLVAYNVKFDYEFLLCSLERYKLPRIRIKNKFDVLAYARAKIPELNMYKLSIVADYIKADQRPTHRAMQDCLSTFDVFKKLKGI